MVPKKGLEPPHPCEYMDLNHARLPIPPLRHEVNAAILRSCSQEGTTPLFSQTEVAVSNMTANN
jgi:hypothetical protein